MPVITAALPVEVMPSGDDSRGGPHDINEVAASNDANPLKIAWSYRIKRFDLTTHVAGETVINCWS